MADATPTNGPTPSEAMFFFKIVQHMKNKGDIDWDAVAESAGFKNAGVARVRSRPFPFSPSPFPLEIHTEKQKTNTLLQKQVRFGQIKRKYGLDGDSPAGKSPSKKNGRGAQPGDLAPTTPTKVTKTRKARGSGRVAKKEESDEEDEAAGEEEAASATVKREEPFPMKRETVVKTEEDKKATADDGFTYF